MDVLQVKGAASNWKSGFAEVNHPPRFGTTESSTERSDSVEADPTTQENLGDMQEHFYSGSISAGKEPISSAYGARDPMLYSANDPMLTAQI